MKQAQILVSRKEEKQQLQMALKSNKPELIALIGRRRVGKTFLIRKAYEDHIKLEITGLQKGKQKSQLKNFYISMRAYGLSPNKEEEHDNWLDTFSLLTQQLEKLNLSKKYVVFFDELPWMAGKRSDFIEGFSYFWNSWASKQPIVVVICGSATSWMIEKVINDTGGLHNRVTDILHLHPFTLKETEEFLAAKNIKYPRYQILLLYMALGGIPMYLDFIRKDLSVVQNINNLCFKTAGFLHDEFNLTRQELLKLTKLPNGGTFSKTLKELQQSDFIKTFSTLGKKKKATLYRLTDAYCLFYLHQIEPNKDSQTLDFEQLFLTAAFKSWSGYAYENVCFSHIYQIKSALGISGILTKIFSYVARPTEDLPGTQIDLLIDRNDHSIHICEVKFSNAPFIIDKKTANNLRQKQAVFKQHSKTKKHLFITFITTFGLVENTWAKETMDDLFR